MNQINKSYSELAQLKTFDERFKYLQVNGIVGEDTFGYDRYLNQTFYSSPEWKRVRRQVVVRDKGCDLGVEGYEISGIIIVHHMIPITKEQILNRDPIVFDTEYLISASLATHNAIHYCEEAYLDKNKVIARSKNDTCPWKTQ